MPRAIGQKTEKTKEALALDAAKEKFKTAVEKGGEKPTAPLQAAIDKAKSELDSAAKADRRERFLRIGGNRVSDVIKSLDALPRLFNAKHYDFTATEATKLVEALTKASTAATTAITAAASAPAGTVAKTQKAFSFT